MTLTLTFWFFHGKKYLLGRGRGGGLKKKQFTKKIKKDEAHIFIKMSIRRNASHFQFLTQIVFFMIIIIFYISIK